MCRLRVAFEMVLIFFDSGRTERSERTDDIVKKYQSIPRIMTIEIRDKM
jgi:hypothetical protein